jgi:iron(III) transport system substrate-binding protein
MGKGFITLLLLLFASLVSAASVEESAKREGEVVFYSSLNNEQIVAFRDAFQKKYPFLRVEFYRGTSERVLQRVSTEAQTGRHAVDVFSSAGFQLQAMKEKGLTARHDVEEPAAFAKGFLDADGQWANLHSLYLAMGYNTKLVSAGEAPKKYEDLLLPKWAGKFGLNIRDVEWFVNMLKLKGREAGLDFMRRLAAQRPAYHEAHNLLAQLLAAGEFHAITNSYGHILAREKEKGAPVQWVLVEPVITYLHPVALARRAPHPNAAKLFMNFILSKDGQRILSAQGRIPSRTDVEAQVLKEVRGMRLFPSDPALARDYESGVKEMRAIFLGKVEPR